MLDKGAPNCGISFTAASMYILDPLDRLAYATAAPIERRYTDIASLPFPLTIRWSSAAHVPFINVMNFQTNEP
jgi:hypothetical protein